jgi:putative hydrolase of the HAD superfamily
MTNDKFTLNDAFPTPPGTRADGLRGCKWVVFDAVGTVIVPAPAVAVAYHAVGARLGSRLTVAEVGKQFRSVFRSSETDQFPGCSVDSTRWATSDSVELARWRWIVREVFSDLNEHEQETCFHELWDHFARSASWRCFDDVGATLVRLARAGLRLAIASNFDGRLEAVCDSLPELAGIERRVISAKVGFRKPAPEFYAAVSRACECQPHEILMVGDDLENDVLAARSAGFQAIHLDRDNSSGTDDSVRSLEELVPWLGIDLIKTRDSLVIQP